MRAPTRTPFRGLPARRRNWRGPTRARAGWMLGLVSLALLPSLSQPAPGVATERIVAVDGAVTEIIYALGAQAVLVGVDTTSTHPAAAQSLPSVGYRRTLTAEGVLSLRPQTLIATAEAGPPKTLAYLRQAGVDVHLLPALHKPEDLIQRVNQVARLVRAESSASELERQLRHALAQVEARRQGMTPRRVLFLLAAGTRGVMVAGKDTQAQQLLDWLGLENVAASTPGYKPLNREAALMLKPDAIVVAETEPGAFKEADWSGLTGSLASASGRMLKADSMYLLGSGPRLPQAMNHILDLVTAGPGSRIEAHD